MTSNAFLYVFIYNNTHVSTQQQQQQQQQRSIGFHANMLFCGAPRYANFYGWMHHNNKKMFF
jgi:hypothetical protein